MLTSEQLVAVKALGLESDQTDAWRNTNLRAHQGGEDIPQATDDEPQDDAVAIAGQPPIDADLPC